MNFIKINKYVISFYTLLSVFFLYTTNIPFFWDNVIQVSVPANWYYDNQFLSFFLPDNIATGHPPLFAIYIAFVWKLLGKTLFVSHLAMVPFLFGLFYQLNRFISLFVSDFKYIFFILVFVLLDPTLLSQSSLVTFEIPYLFFFFLCINLILRGKQISLSIAFLFLCLISLRGFISGIGVVFFVLLHFSKQKNIIKIIIPFIPGVLALLVFLFIHYLSKGWFIHNTVSNEWPDARTLASLPSILKNFLVFNWALLDFGRIAIWITTLYVFIKSYKNKIVDKNCQTLIQLICSQYIIFMLTTIFFNNTIGHRYLLPIIVLFSILFCYLLIQRLNFKALIYSLLAFILISSNYIVYPEKKSQAWDASLAHWFYHDVRTEMISYLDENNISRESVGSFYPNLYQDKYYFINENSKSFDKYDFHNHKYLLYSNVFNLSDRLIDQINSNGIEIYNATKNNVFIKLIKMH